MTKLKYLILTLIMASTLMGGVAQLMTLNFNVIACYNAYFQLGVGVILFVWLAHKLISRYEIRVVKPPVNNRDKK